MAQNSHEKKTELSRRTIVKGAAWSVPAVALAVAAPAHAASTTITPGIVVTAGNGPWTDDQNYDGWIADGVTITLADSQGQPLPVGTVVTLRISERADGTGWVRNNLWLVTDPSLSANASRQQANQHQSITLVLTTPGQLDLYPTSATGYLRKGSNGERDGQYLSVTVGAVSSQVHLINSSAYGGTNPGVQPA